MAATNYGLGCVLFVVIAVAAQNQQQQPFLQVGANKTAKASPTAETPVTKNAATSSPCNLHTTCSSCLQASGNCAWCYAPKFGDKPRCFASGADASAAAYCPAGSTMNPQSTITLVEQRPLSGMDAKSSDAEKKLKTVQITPQRVKIDLRINQPFKFDMAYARAKDYPVDLYYLMDLSNSMKDDKHMLSQQSNKLAAALQRITSDYRLGFGSFVDKVLMPFVSMVPNKLKQPCEGCSAPYGFRHHMKLEKGAAKFIAEVKASNISANLDSPEGGFDAIMQAIVCREEIGWRAGARRLLLFSTDAGFHYAGDGKLAGVIVPNDGKCHLDETGLYTLSTQQDYPSVSHINYMAKQHAVNIIFAVTASNTRVYEKLSKNVEGSSWAQLADDSANVVELVEKEYNKISSSIEMKDNAPPSIQITYHSSCRNNGTYQKTKKCDGLHVGEKVTFGITITATSCPKRTEDRRQIIEISPVGLEETMIVEVQLLCDCDCGDNKQSSEDCGHGHLNCGICQCDKFFSGKNCECDATSLTDLQSKSTACRANKNSTVECSGRGQCVCGQCECAKRDSPNEEISGEFCQCENFSCDRSGGKLCSGPTRGKCECGQCTCLDGFKGDACECPVSEETCMPLGGGELCSGHGECECGHCKCTETAEGRYTGAFCEHCPLCQSRCDELRDCVQCQMYRVGPLAAGKPGDQCAERCSLQLESVPTGGAQLEADVAAGEVACKYYDDDGCKYQFVYANETLRVRAQQERECPRPVPVLWLVMVLTAAIVLIGMALLLLWKLLTTIHDRREFAKFEMERAAAKWDTGENPLYKGATTTFMNPSYKA